ncbi:dynein heavy chain and region d6 of dynein motor domain-containing protein [Phthorimaea operculella]|nr:dynein heavy chain and region d6 of dynein motor domain-containing protein [Phthorimaea operculella]
MYGECTNLGSIPVWLGGLLNPEAYITATRQCVAQANSWSLEELHLQVTECGISQSIPVWLGYWATVTPRRTSRRRGKHPCVAGLLGYCNPEAYITATRQCVAQANSWSLEELHLQVTECGISQSIPVWLGYWATVTPRRTSRRRGKHPCVAGLLGYCNPEAYITATRQCVAQANSWSLEELHLQVTIPEPGTPAENAGAEWSFSVTGLKLQGATVKGNRLLLTNTIMVDLPLTVLTWIRSDGLKLQGATVKGNRLLLTNTIMVDLPLTVLTWIRKSDGLKLQGATVKGNRLLLTNTIMVDLPLTVLTWIRKSDGLKLQGATVKGNRLLLTNTIMVDLPLTVLTWIRSV